MITETLWLPSTKCASAMVADGLTEDVTICTMPASVAVIPAWGVDRGRTLLEVCSPTSADQQGIPGECQPTLVKDKREAAYKTQHSLHGTDLNLDIDISISANVFFTWTYFVF